MLGQTGAQIGQPASQTFFEFMTLLVALLIWGDASPGAVLQILGDNMDAFQQSLQMRGRGAMLAVSREFACRRARFNWKFAVAHLPSESNSVANALSRQSDPESLPFPTELMGLPRRKVPDLSRIWLAEVES